MQLLIYVTTFVFVLSQDKYEGTGYAILPLALHGSEPCAGSVGGIGEKRR
jgi:hypothetical protein